MKSELPRQRNLVFWYLPGLNEQIFGLVHLSDANRESKVKHKRCSHVQRKWMQMRAQCNRHSIWASCIPTWRRNLQFFTLHLYLRLRCHGSHVWTLNAISLKTVVCADSKTWCLSRGSSHVCFLALALLVSTCPSFCSYPMRHKMAFVAALQEMRGSKRGARRGRISIQPKTNLVRKPKCRVSQLRAVDEVSISKS